MFNILALKCKIVSFTVISASANIHKKAATTGKRVKRITIIVCALFFVVSLIFIVLGQGFVSRLVSFIVTVLGLGGGFGTFFSKIETQCTEWSEQHQLAAAGLEAIPAKTDRQER
jgi:hypothetical protein